MTAITLGMATPKYKETRMARKELPPVEYLHNCFEYDPETGLFVWKSRPIEHFASVRSFNRWNNMYSGQPAFLIDYSGYCKSKISAVSYSGHRVAWAMHYGKWPTGEIDHINGITHDNRISNLRDVPKCENQRNRRKNKNNTSGVSGVNYNKRIGKWQVQICNNGRNVHLGYFNDLEEAKKVRIQANKDFGYSERHGA